MPVFEANGSIGITFLVQKYYFIPIKFVIFGIDQRLNKKKKDTLPLSKQKIQGRLSSLKYKEM